MDFDKLLRGCESEIEERLLQELYPTLGPDSQGDLHPQYKIDYYADLPVTLPEDSYNNGTAIEKYPFHLTGKKSLIQRNALRTAYWIFDRCGTVSDINIKEKENCYEF